MKNLFTIFLLFLCFFIQAQNIEKLILNKNVGQLFILTQEEAEINGNPILIHLILEHNYDLAKTLLDKGINPDVRDTNNVSAIMWAIHEGNVHFVKYYFNKINFTHFEKREEQNQPPPFLGVIPGPDKSYYGSPLNLAAALSGENYFEILKYMIEDLNFNVDEKEYDKDGYQSNWTPLFWAVGRNDTSLVNYLIKKGANCTAYFTTPDYTFIYPMSYASMLGQYSMVLEMSNCADNTSSAYKRMLIATEWEALRNGNEIFFRELLKRNQGQHHLEKLAVKAIDIEALSLAHQLVDMITVLDPEDLWDGLTGGSLLERAYYFDEGLFDKVLSKSPTLQVQSGESFQSILLRVNCTDDNNCIKNLKKMIDAGGDPFFPLTLDDSSYHKTPAYTAFTKRQNDLVDFYIKNYKNEFRQYPDVLLRGLTRYVYSLEETEEYSEDGAEESNEENNTNEDRKRVKTIFEKLDLQFTLDLAKDYPIINTAEELLLMDEDSYFSDLFRKYCTNYDKYINRLK